MLSFYHCLYLFTVISRDLDPATRKVTGSGSFKRVKYEQNLKPDRVSPCQRPSHGAFLRFFFAARRPVLLRHPRLNLSLPLLVRAPVMDNKQLGRAKAG